LETILLVDDDPASLQFLVSVLEAKVSCKLLVATSGETALQIARKSVPDLILLDVVMPVMDGFEVCQRLKADPVTNPIPVVFLSALSDTVDKVKGLELGAVDYIAKPYQPDEVLARVNTQLTIRRLSLKVREQRDALEAELQVVSDVQRQLLPPALPEVAGLKLAVYYEACLRAGGDYYDVSLLPGGGAGLLVADAVGHGAPAAVLMAMTCTLFRSCAHLHADPAKTLDYINTNLCLASRDTFVTAIYGVFDRERRVLKVARAAHPNPIIFTPGQGAREVDTPGTAPLGWMPFDQVPVSEIALRTRDRVLLYTDGVSELFDPAQRLYGERRICRQLEVPTDGAQAAIDALVSDLKRHSAGRPADDDQALLLAVID
jgi:sigma-B regulation protein RsbU (phosphoserine phosphatase)